MWSNQPKTMTLARDDGEYRSGMLKSISFTSWAAITHDANYITGTCNRIEFTRNAGKGKKETQCAQRAPHQDNGKRFVVMCDEVCVLHLESNVVLGQ